MNKLSIGEIALLIITIFFYCYASHRIGYSKGVGVGVDRTLDTIDYIINKQIQMEDSTVSEIVLIKKDTVTYVLSKKNIIK
jgi:hypothetical protein